MYKDEYERRASELLDVYEREGEFGMVLNKNIDYGELWNSEYHVVYENPYFFVILFD